MKNFNLFMNKKKEKLKIAGSIVGGVTIIALSSCNVSNVKNDSSSVEIPILSSVSTTTISNNNTPNYSTTSNKTQNTTKETTTQTTTTSTTTKAPETIPTTTNEVIITPSPVTTNIPATEKPVESTAKVTTKVTQTTTKTTTTKKEEPIEYETKTDEITGYYNNFEANDTIELTKQNINNYNDFMSSTENFYFSITGPFVQYHTYANLDTGKYENYETDSYIERILLVTLLNEKYINDNSLKKILKPYTKNDLDITAVNITFIFQTDIDNEIYYDYSKIMADKDLAKTLNNMQNAYKKGDYKTVEKLCNQSWGKNDMADILMLVYEHNMPEIEAFPIESPSVDLALKIIDKTGIYDRAHQKVLVKQ